MRFMAIALLTLLLTAVSAPAWAAAPPGVMPQAGALPYYCPPPRFQIFQAPRPYGGLLMMDTKSGESWQRVIVNTPKGIEIRWLKLQRVKEIPEGQTILWN